MQQHLISGARDKSWHCTQLAPATQMQTTPTRPIPQAEHRHRQHRHMPQHAAWLLLVIFACASMLLSKNAWAGNQEREVLSPYIKTNLHNSIINPVPPRLLFPSKEEANAWLTTMSSRLKRWIPDDFLRNRYLVIIQYEAKRAGLDPQMVLSVITVESRFNKYAIPVRGDAQGMMQVRPFWRELVGSNNDDLFDIRTNLRYGCNILRYYLDQEHGNYTRALARYNGTLGQEIYPQKVFSAYDKYWAYAS